MRYNVTFTLKKEKEEIKMFEVVDNNSNDRTRILSYLNKKYPDYKVSISLVNLISSPVLVFIFSINFGK